MQITYTGINLEDIIVTRKVNGDVISYGITGVDGVSDDCYLGYYPVGYNDSQDKLESLDGTTTNYTFYVVGKGIASLKLNIDIR